MMDPHKTMLVIKHEGREVGRISATAKNVQAYLEELARFYNGIEIDCIPDENAEFLAMLHGI